MTAADRELLRIALLRVLEANNTRFGLGAPALRLSLGQWGFRDLDEKTLGVELGYLFDKGFAAVVAKDISPEMQTWRITANGRDWLAQNG